MMGTDPCLWIGIGISDPYPDSPFFIRSFADPDPDRIADPGSRSNPSPLSYIYYS